MSCVKSFTAILPIVFVSLLSLLALSQEPTGSSEAREAHVVSEMLSGGSLVLPKRYGVIPSKPPAFHWFGAVVSSITGFSPVVSLRLVSVFSAFCVLLLTMHLAKVWARFLWPDNLILYQWSGVVSGMVLSLTYGFLRMALEARVDMLFTLFVTLAMTVLLVQLPDRTSRVPVFIRIAFYFFCALATLTKGPLGIVLPGCLSAVCIYSFTRSVKPVVQLLRPQLGWLLYLIIVLIWYVFAYREGGGGFFSRQIVFENLDRLLGSANIPSKPFWYYIPALFKSAFPWSLIVPIQLVIGFKIHSVSAKQLDQRRKRLFTLPFVWMLAGLILFSLSVGKRSSYLLPLFVPLAINFAFYCVGRFNFISDAAIIYLARCRRLVFYSFMFFVLLLIAVVEALRWPIYFSNPLIEFAHQQLLPFLGTLELLLCLLLVNLFYRSFRRSNVCLDSLMLWSAFFIVFCFSVELGVLVKGSYKRYSTTAARICHILPEGQRLAVLKSKFDEIFDPLLYRLHLAERDVALYPLERSFHDIRESGDSMVLLRKKDYLVRPTSNCEIVGFAFSSDYFRNRHDRDLVLVDLSSCGGF